MKEMDRKVRGRVKEMNGDCLGKRVSEREVDSHKRNR